MNKKLWLRSEKKENERRCALTPENAKKLIELGVEVIVEESPMRIFDIQLYKDAGCKIVKEHSWLESASNEDYVLGLKELEDATYPLTHKHIYFAHIFKGQDGAQQVLDRYLKGGGTLFDLEFLTDSNSRRIAAFGYWAGYVGAALAIENYLSLKDDKISPLRHYKDKEEWIAKIKTLNGSFNEVKPIIIGAKGRCGQGARDLFSDLSMSSTNWDLEETKKGGPFKEIIKHDVFINTVLMTKKIPPFLDRDLLKENQKLKVICDVSCDPNSDLNPIPVYDQHTTWECPTVKSNGVNIIAIDNLPSALPKESSIDFSNQLFPHLKDLLMNGEEATAWSNAKNTFISKLK